MSTTILRHLLTCGILCLASACNADTTPPHPVPADAAWLAQQGIATAGTLVDARRVTDKFGEHVLVLTRKEGSAAGRVERIDLLAAYYVRAGTAWKQEWTIRDGVDCPGLDADAGFYVKAITFTDLNGDGRVEATVPYHTFCGGGIDSQTVKVILREGATKLAIRGASRVELPGQKPFGGEHQADKALDQPALAAYKRHLEAVWQAVSVDKR
jgi:hypothetical protein